MQALGFYSALPFLYLISLLPAFILYFFSDIIFLIVYHMIGYRKKVVMENLRNSFPEKSEAELNKIMKEFYSFLCDLFIETVMMLTISENYVKKHCTFDREAQQLFNSYEMNKQSIVVAMGHFGNWEWAGYSFPLHCRQQLYVIYRPLSNPFWNSLIENMRGTFGTKLIEMDETFSKMMRNRRVVSSTVFIADQTPPPEDAYWTDFLNQDTPVFRGIELISRKLNFPVVYASVKRVKRGYYQIYAETLFEEPAKTIGNEISEAHTRRLEADIREQPETWLWSHRRWKHKKFPPL
ncbi:MAG: lysophospholipid acyltransferase family protein [Chitinophagales bacterium]